VTDTIQGLAPENTALPTISGTTSQGQTLTADPGSWNYEPTSYTYQWQQCFIWPWNCWDVFGATNSTYTLGWGDSGNMMRVVVTATNVYGTSDSTTSAMTDSVEGLPPANISSPWISGTTTQGQTLWAENGDWSKLPLQLLLPVAAL